MGLVDCTMSKGPADQTHHMKGRLHVEVVEARGLKDLDTWGKMSPACSVQIGKQFQRTKNRGHAGLKVWFEPDSDHTEVMTQDEEVVAEETGHMETHDEVYEEVEEVVEV